MKATAVPHEGFDERHFALAAAHGISRDRILFVRSLEEMRFEARRLCVDVVEIEAYGDDTLGLRICDVPGGPDAFVLLKGPLTENAHIKTFIRLSRATSDSFQRILATEEPELLYAFILLHEIAHHVLAHGKAVSSEAICAQETEADSWAWSELKKHWNQFPAPGPSPEKGGIRGCSKLAVARQKTERVSQNLQYCVARSGRGYENVLLQAETLCAKWAT